MPGSGSGRSAGRPGAAPQMLQSVTTPGPQAMRRASRRRCAPRNRRPPRHGCMADGGEEPRGFFQAAGQVDQRIDVLPPPPRSPVRCPPTTGRSLPSFWPKPTAPARCLRGCAKPPDHQTAFADTLRSGVLPPGVTAHADVERRFTVYRNNVAHSLSRALAAQFPAIKRLLGAESFATVALSMQRPADPAPRHASVGRRLGRLARRPSGAGPFPLSAGCRADRTGAGPRPSCRRLHAAGARKAGRRRPGCRVGGADASPRPVASRLAPTRRPPCRRHPAADRDRPVSPAPRRRTSGGRGPARARSGLSRCSIR